jgi:hypothetical protein
MLDASLVYFFFFLKEASILGVEETIQASNSHTPQGMKTKDIWHDSPALLSHEKHAEDEHASSKAVTTSEHNCGCHSAYSTSTAVNVRVALEASYLSAAIRRGYS